MIVALYCRVSTEEQATQGFSIDHQRERLIAYCVSQGWDDYRLYIDDGYTGTKLDRPAMNRMIRHIEEGKIQTVVVYKLDRLSRKQRDALYLLEEVFDKCACAFKSATEPFDTSTPLGKAMLGILAVFAQLERDTIVERTTSGRRMRIKRGLWSGGRIPYGYHWDKAAQRLIIIPERAEIVRQVFRLYLQGKSLLEISDWFTDRVSEIKLDHSGIRDMITRVIYTGRLSTGTGDVVDGKHDAIIDDEIFSMAQVERSRRSAGLTPAHSYLLSGLCKCGVCGGSVIRVRMSSRGYSYNYYVCKDQHVRSRERKGKEYCKSGYNRQEKLEEWVVKEVRETSLNMESVQAKHLALLNRIESESATASTNLKDQLKSIDDRLNRWYDAFESGTMNPSLLKERVRGLEEERSKILLQIEDSENVVPEKANAQHTFAVLRIIDKSWDDADFEERQALLRAAIGKIILYPNRENEIFWNV